MRAPRSSCRSRWARCWSVSGTTAICSRPCSRAARTWLLSSAGCRWLAAAALADRAVASAAMDTVLAAPRPSLSLSDALAIAAGVFGVGAQSAQDLGSERDMTIALLDDADRLVAVL